MILQNTAFVKLNVSLNSEDFLNLQYLMFELHKSIYV